MFGVRAEAAQTPSFLRWFYFLGLFSLPFYPFAHYLPHPLYVPSPLTFFPLCSFLFPLTPLFIRALSPSIWWNSAADNACNWSDSHFSSVFGPDKEYCQHFADMASAGRIKWTLFCSVCSKLKASQFICSRPRLTGASYSHRNTVERGGRKRIREISLFPKKHQSGFFSFLSESLHSATIRWRQRGNERSRLIVWGEVKISSEGSQRHYSARPLAAVSCCLCTSASLCNKGVVFAFKCVCFRAFTNRSQSANLSVFGC